jgi:hypothetical protein
MKEQIIKIIESKAQGKYHLEIDESDLEVIANEILNLFSVSYYGETLYNTNGVIPSKIEDEKPRIVTFKDNCS